MEPVGNAILDGIEVALRVRELLHKGVVLLLRLVVLLDELNHALASCGQGVDLLLQLHRQGGLLLKDLLLLRVALGKVFLVLRALPFHFLFKLNPLDLKLLVEVVALDLNALPVLRQLGIAVVLEELIQFLSVGHCGVPLALRLFNLTLDALDVGF